MSKAVLIVDANDARRAAVRGALASRGLLTLEVPDPFSGLAALGRADFGAVIVAEGKRHLSLRGMIQLAKKRHGAIRIFVILSNAANGAHLATILGDDVNMVPPEWGVEQLAAAVVPAIEAQGGVSNPWQGDSAVDLPERVTMPPPGAPESPSTPPPSSPPPTEVFLEGTLEAGSGAGLLMGLFAQELTGKLSVRTEEEGWPTTIYFYRGEPVWADDPDGDAGLFRRLVAQRMLPPTLAVDPVAQGTLLQHLMQAGRLSADQVHEIMRQTIREHVLALANQTEGFYDFAEDRSFLEHAPLLKLNPFGLIIESRRKAYAPDRLLAIGGEISGQYLHPGPGLGVAAEKLKPFVREIDMAEAIDGKHTVEQFCEATSLDMLMGTLMVLTLSESRLVALRDDEMMWDESQVNVTRESVLRSEWDELSLPEVETGEHGVPLTASPEGVLSREEILSLYVRLKPLTQPRQVLGVPLHADGLGLKAAYEARLKELDDSRVPECNDADVLRSHLGELRRKVQSAYDALTQAQPAGEDPTRDSNPF